MSLRRAKTFAKKIISATHWPSVSVLTALTALTLVFQNCGKAGFDGSGDVTAASIDGPEIAKYKAAPFPFDVNANQISYMTCPAVAGTEIPGEDMDSPYYTLRVGAFDNRPLAARYPQHFPAAGLPEPERTARLSAGIGLTKEFIDYVKTNFALKLQNSSADDQTKVYRDAIMNSTYAFNLQTGLLLYPRSSEAFTDGITTDKRGTGWTKPVLDKLVLQNIANQLVATNDLGIYGREKINTLTGTEAAARTLISSLAVSQTEVERDTFRSKLLMFEFALGFAKNGSTLVTDLESPTNDNLKTLFGRTYRFTPTSTWPGRINRSWNTTTRTVDYTAPDPALNEYPNYLATVHEYKALPTSSGATTYSVEDMTTTEGQQWDCFSLMVVREPDRRNPTDYSILDPGDYEDVVASRNCTLWDTFKTGNAATDCMQKLKFYDFQLNAQSPAIPAAKAACPNQLIGDETRFGSLNYQGADRVTWDGLEDRGLARLRLEVARRFLGADFWDINTNPEYMCAVPKVTTQGYGNCYASGDFDSSKYIMYTQKAQQITGVNADGSVAKREVVCGRNPITGELQKECPAFVNICYRTK